MVETCRGTLQRHARAMTPCSLTIFPTRIGAFIPLWIVEVIGLCGSFGFMMESEWDALLTGLTVAWLHSRRWLQCQHWQCQGCLLGLCLLDFCNWCYTYVPWSRCVLAFASMCRTGVSVMDNVLCDGVHGCAHALAVFSIFLPLKLDDQTSWSWIIVFLPLWLAIATPGLSQVGCCCDMCSVGHCQSGLWMVRVFDGALVCPGAGFGTAEEQECTHQSFGTPFSCFRFSNVDGPCSDHSPCVELGRAHWVGLAMARAPIVVRPACLQRDAGGVVNLALAPRTMQDL